MSEQLLNLLHAQHIPIGGLPLMIGRISFAAPTVATYEIGVADDRNSLRWFVCFSANTGQVLSVRTDVRSTEKGWQHKLHITGGQLDRSAPGMMVAQWSIEAMRGLLQRQAFSR